MPNELKIENTRRVIEAAKIEKSQIIFFTR